MLKKLIVALDYDTEEDALTLVDQLDPSLCALKVGSEMFTFFGTDLIKTLTAREFNIFLDLKFHDIPNTVAQACKAAAELGVWMMNVHACGGMAMMQAARKALTPYGSSRPLLIAVTVLTSMGAEDLRAAGINESLEERVCDLARLAREADLDGVVSSALEVPAIKAVCGADFLAITPGIRLTSNMQDDQVRVTTPELALKAGSDYLVIGRPITQASDPALVVHQILKSMK